MKPKFLNFFGLVILGLIMSDIHAQPPIHEEIGKLVQEAPFKMGAPELPEIGANADTITKFGAIGDGTFLNTISIQNAIDSSAAKGGGKVVIPPGIWLTGPVALKSNINLHLMEGAILLFTKDHTQYPLIGKDGKYTVMSPIYANNLHDIAITGKGIINGNGASWRPVKKVKLTEGQWKALTKSGGVVTSDGGMWWPSEEAKEAETYLKNLKNKKKSALAEDFVPARDFLRPYMVLINHCKRVLIDGPTLMNSPKFGLVPKGCRDLIIRDVTINNEWYAQNGDGMDIGDSKNVIVYKCTVTAGDDGICMKSNYSAKDSNAATLQNVIISDCKVYHGHGGFVIGSNEGGGMENIYVHNCSFIGTDAGIRVKSSRDRGGLVQHIFLDGIYMENIQGPAIVFNSYYEQKDNARTNVPVTRTTPRFQYFKLSNIYCSSASESISLTGLPEYPVNHIYFEHVRILADKDYHAVDAKDIYFKDVEVNGSKL